MSLGLGIAGNRKTSKQMVISSSLSKDKEQAQWKNSCACCLPWTANYAFVGNEPF